MAALIDVDGRRSVEKLRKKSPLFRKNFSTIEIDAA
jgi:hypothetical protein